MFLRTSRTIWKVRDSGCLRTTATNCDLYIQARNSASLYPFLSHSMHTRLENIALPMNDHHGAALSDVCRKVMSARLKPYNSDGTVEDRQPAAR